MSPELELLDVLGGTDEPLSVCLNIFPSVAFAQRSIRELLRNGMVEILDASQSSIPLWKWDSWCRSESEWSTVVETLTLHLTDKGVDHMG